MAIVRKEVSDRTVFGKIVKWLFILFNILMIVILLRGCAAVSEVAVNTQDSAAAAGVGLGATLGVGMLLVFWVMGDIIIGIVVLAAMFVVATVLPVNMGLLGLAAAFAVGLYAGIPTAEVVGGFPSGLFLTLVGITFLFAVAHANGTIGRIVAASVGAVRGHVWAIPWIMFATAAVLTAFGAVSPAAVAILAPIALGFAVQHRISPMLMGMMADRTSYVVTQGGKIAFTYSNLDPDGHVAGTLKAVRALKPGN